MSSRSAQEVTIEPMKHGGRYRCFSGSVRRHRRDIEAVVYTRSWRALAEILGTTVSDVRDNWCEQDEDEALDEIPGGAVAAANPGSLVVHVHQRWLLDGEEARGLLAAAAPILRERSAPVTSIAAGSALQLRVYLDIAASAWVVGEAIARGIPPEQVVEDAIAAAARLGAA